jgi:hypothetical protein
MVTAYCGRYGAESTGRTPRQEVLLKLQNQIPTKSAPSNLDRPAVYSATAKILLSGAYDTTNSTSVQAHQNSPESNNKEEESKDQDAKA